MQNHTHTHTHTLHKTILSLAHTMHFVFSSLLLILCFKNADATHCIVNITLMSHNLHL